MAKKMDPTAVIMWWAAVALLPFFGVLGLFIYGVSNAYHQGRFWRGLLPVLAVVLAYPLPFLLIVYGVIPKNPAIPFLHEISYGASCLAISWIVCRMVAKHR